MSKDKSIIKTGKIRVRSSRPPEFLPLGKSEYDIPILEEIILEPEDYPAFEIKQWDLCQNMDENVDIWLTTKISMRKKDFFELVKIISASFETWKEERLKTEIIIRLLRDKTKKAINEDNPRCASKIEIESEGGEKG